MAHQASSRLPSDPGPLIWVVILLAAVTGAIWGTGTAIVVGLAATALLVLIRLTLEQLEKRKRAEPMPPLPGETRGVSGRMLGRGLQHDISPSDDASSSGLHLPRRMVPPPGHHLDAAVAVGDMYTAINATRDHGDKAAVLITRCFDNALHCDARQWSTSSAKDAASKIFGEILDRGRLSEMHAVAEEAVRLGYRTATPLDLEVTLGTKTDDSWRRELASLVARARRCAEFDVRAVTADATMQRVIDSLVERLASAGQPQAGLVPHPLATDVIYGTVVPVALAWICIQRGARDAGFMSSTQFHTLRRDAAQAMFQCRERALRVLNAEWNLVMPQEMKGRLAAAGLSVRWGGDSDASRERAEAALQACMSCVAVAGKVRSTAEAEISLSAWAAARLEMNAAELVQMIRGLPTA